METRSRVKALGSGIVLLAVVVVAGLLVAPARGDDEDDGWVEEVAEAGASESALGLLEAEEPPSALPGEEERVVGVPTSELPEVERAIAEEVHAREVRRESEHLRAEEYAEGLAEYAERIEAERVAGVEVVP